MHRKFGLTLHITDLLIQFGSLGVVDYRAAFPLLTEDAYACRKAQTVAVGGYLDFDSPLDGRGRAFASVVYYSDLWG